MKVEFKKTFLKDIKRLTDKRLQNAVAKAILQVETAETLAQVKGLKKLSGYEKHFRIRIGVGLKVEDQVVYFVVLEHRKDIYKGFP